MYSSFFCTYSIKELTYSKLIQLILNIGRIADKVMESKDNPEIFSDEIGVFKNRKTQFLYESNIEENLL